MKDGQVILITDSQTQQKNLEPGIISKAKALNTCVNSFISPFTARGYKHDPIADGLYERVSKGTSGLFVPPTVYSPYQLGKFSAESANRPCGSKPGETVTPTKKPDGSHCATVKVSTFAKLLKLAMESPSSPITITDPKGEKYSANVVHKLAIFSKSM